MFCSTELAARIERAECNLLGSGAAAVARRQADVRVFARPLCGGIAICTQPGAALNKIAGLGFAGPLDLDALAEAEREFAARGVPVQIEVSTLADTTVVQALTRRGYALMGFENVLGQALPARETVRPEGIAVAEAADARDAWADTVLAGFQNPDTQGIASHERPDWDVAARELRDFAQTAGLVPFLARRGGTVAGGASMVVQGGVAILCGAATLPAHRRLGVHKALLAERLARAAAAGCTLAVLTALPGSKSHENAQRRGFELLYSRTVLVK